MRSFSQAEERWGLSGAHTIQNAASILRVFGGLSVAKDLEELSRLSGTRQVERASFSEDGRGRMRISRNLTDAPLLSASAIHALEDGMALICWGRLPPIVAHLPGIWERRDARVLAEEERLARKANGDARRERAAAHTTGRIDQHKKEGT